MDLDFGMLRYKTDLDLWDCLGRVKLILLQKFYRTDLVICSHSMEGKPPSHSQINMVNRHNGTYSVIRQFFTHPK